MGVCKQLCGLLGKVLRIYLMREVPIPRLFGTGCGRVLSKWWEKRDDCVWLSFQFHWHISVISSFPGGIQVRPGVKRSSGCGFLP